jgi:hypothetical protein
MQAKMARLLTERATSIRAVTTNLDPKVFAARYVYPQIATQAYKGEQDATITGLLSEPLTELLRSQGYVVRQLMGNTYSFTIEWRDQYIGTRKVTPDEYNAHIAQQKRQFSLLP